MEYTELVEQWKQFADEATNLELDVKLIESQLKSIECDPEIFAMCAYTNDKQREINLRGKYGEALLGLRKDLQQTKYNLKLAENNSKYYYALWMYEIRGTT
jgi:hypothetical protein